jgi:hypothetical protein
MHRRQHFVGQNRWPGRGQHLAPAGDTHAEGTSHSLLIVARTP